MRKLKVAIIILGAVFAISVVLNILGILVVGKLFIYNLSQMEYEDARRAVINIPERQMPGEYYGYWDEDLDAIIDRDLARYLAEAEKLAGWERTLYELRPSLHSGIGSQIIKCEVGVYLILLTWKELWDGIRIDKEMEARCQKYS